MSTIYDADQSEVVEKAAEELKKINEIKAPEWAAFAKTGAHKERPPAEKDWWCLRSASVLRLVYKLGPIGVSKLRAKYGGKKNRGMKPERFYKASGNIIRKILQQLEKAGFIKQGEKGKHKGRVITKEGKTFLDKVATQIVKGSIVKKEIKKEKKEIIAEKPIKETKEKSEKEAKKKEIKEKPKEEKKPKEKEIKEKVPTAHELAKKR